MVICHDVQMIPIEFGVSRSKVKVIGDIHVSQIFLVRSDFFKFVLNIIYIYISQKWFHQFLTVLWIITVLFVQYFFFKCHVLVGIRCPWQPDHVRSVELTITEILMSHSCVNLVRTEGQQMAPLHPTSSLIASQVGSSPFSYLKIVY